MHRRARTAGTRFVEPDRRRRPGRRLSRPRHAPAGRSRSRWLPDAVADDSGARERFSPRARRCRRCSHPNIVTLYEVGEEDGPFLAFEFVQGQTLKTIIGGRPLNPAARRRPGRPDRRGASPTRTRRRRRARRVSARPTSSSRRRATRRFSTSGWRRGPTAAVRGSERHA